MIDSNSPALIFEEQTKSLRSFVVGFIDAAKAPGTPARSMLGLAQTKLLQGAFHAYYTAQNEIIESSFEQIVTQAAHIYTSAKYCREGFLEVGEVEPEMITVANKLFIQLKVAEHNFALAAGIDLKTGVARPGEDVFMLIDHNAAALRAALQAGRCAKTDGEFAAIDENYARDTSPLSYEQIVAVVHHEILPELERSVVALHQALPELSHQHSRSAQITYGEMLAKWPDLADRFVNTGNAFFDDAGQERLAELQVATWYNDGTYRQTPIKPVIWHEAGMIDQMAKAKLKGLDY